MASSLSPSPSTSPRFFEGKHFIVELGPIALACKKDVLAAIESHGGHLDFVISKRTTHVITTPEISTSYKLKSAATHGCFVLVEQFLKDCVAAGSLLDEWPYLLLGSTPAVTLAPSSAAYVGRLLSVAYSTVATVAHKAYRKQANEALTEGVLNIAALCISLGAQIPKGGSTTLKPIVNDMYSKLYKPPGKKSKNVKTQPPQPTKPPKIPRTPSPARNPPPSPPPQIPPSPSTQIPPSHPLAPSSSSSLFKSSSPRPSFTFSKPLFSPRPSPLPQNPLPSSSFSSLSLPKSSPSSYFSSTSSYFSPKPPSTPLAPPASSSLLSSSLTPSPPQKSSSSYFNIPPSSSKVSYSYAQFEEERKKKKEEEKAKRLEENGGVLREREERRKAEEEARKKDVEEKKQELLERRKKEDDERKRKVRELIEAREQKILVERKKREAAIEKLKLKPAHDLLVTSFFRQWDEEEIAKKSEEEWQKHVQEIIATKEEEENKEKTAQERIAKREGEKQRKHDERMAELEKEKVLKAREKLKRKKAYEKQHAIDTQREKKEFEEKQKKSLEEFLAREKRRQKKKLLEQKGLNKLAEVPQIDTDLRKIFVGGIKFDDIAKAKLDPKLAAKVKDERINSILRMFESFGTITKRKVFADEGHCFVVFQDPASVATAMEVMQNAEERKVLVEAAKVQLLLANQHPLCAPAPTFYVRIPKAKLKKEKKKTKEETKKPPPTSTPSPLRAASPFTPESSKPPSPRPSSPPSHAQVPDLDASSLISLEISDIPTVEKEPSRPPRSKYKTLPGLTLLEKERTKVPIPLSNNTFLDFGEEELW